MHDNSDFFKFDLRSVGRF